LWKFWFLLFYLKGIKLCAKNQVFVFVEHMLITKYIVQPILKAKKRTAQTPQPSLIAVSTIFFIAAENPRKKFR